MTIEQVNELHRRAYGSGNDRKYPKNGIVRIDTVNSASKWLRKNTKNGKLLEK